MMRKVSETIQKLLNLYLNPKVKLLKKALKRFTKSYEVDIIRNDPLKQLTNTRKIAVDKLVENLNVLKDLKWVSILQITFEKQNKKLNYKQASIFNSKADIILNKNDLIEIQSTHQIVSKIGNWIKQGSNWIIKSLDKHYFNVTLHSPLNARSYIYI